MEPHFLICKIGKLTAPPHWLLQRWRGQRKQLEHSYFSKSVGCFPPEPLATCSRSQSLFPSGWAPLSRDWLLSTPTTDQLHASNAPAGLLPPPHPGGAQ